MGLRSKIFRRFFLFPDNWDYACSKVEDRVKKFISSKMHIDVVDQAYSFSKHFISIILYYTSIEDDS